ncbi:GEM-like protein 1 [Oryza brachyantha]|uniref:GEM-like protein 1 n=1 Tax=Oryza brachyantha TaxID=4533 RepID=UPI0003EABBFE|nr:GEM-like protein 1 [Oryza brachyantha]
MATSWTAPPPGYPQVGGQPAYPQQSSSTAVAVASGSSGVGNPYVFVTPASNGVGNPYVIVTPASASPSTCHSIRKALERYGKKLEDGTRKAADTTGNIWHHLRTAPNMADAAVARLAQGTKVYAEGGHDRVFQQAFGVVPGEQLRKAYACYLSTSTGPVIGTLYLSTARLAFCSDSPLPYQAPGAGAAAGGHPPEGIYYKVVLPLNQVKSVNPSASMTNRGEKYIQITTTDNHEFWFLGFVSYDKALKNLYEALQRRA